MVHQFYDSMGMVHEMLPSILYGKIKLGFHRKKSLEKHLEAHGKTWS